ncbi:MAG TPA: LytTR family DNA-binding domain-containing protein [Fluviicola sp.]|nr:LytTR family DNA-binding domain-containing protein [Fluviicola sp.]
MFFDKHRPLILRSLNSLEEKLDPNYFFRANRKFIVNLNWIEKIENWFNGGLQIELKSFKVQTASGEEVREGEKMEISRRQAIKFKELFTIYFCTARNCLLNFSRCSFRKASIS